MSLAHLLVSSPTKQRINNVTEQQPQSLLIVGQKGSGRTVIAELIAAKVLCLSPVKLHDYAYFSLLKPDGNSVKIEQIQNLKKLLSLKTPVTEQAIRRVIIIESSELMSRDAQNAALKFIEEPPVDTMIMLIVENERDVLQTIRSRCATFFVANPTEDEAVAYAKQELSASSSNAAQQYKLSGGRSGLFLALLQNADHPLASAIAKSRTILAASKFEKIVMVDELSKDKELANNVLFALDRIAQVGLQQAAEKDQLNQIKRWAGVLQALEDAGKQIRSNASSKLIFTNLMLVL